MPAAPESMTIPPIPEDLKEESVLLLDLLETWQEALPEMQQHIDLQEISDVDHALSTLIIHLREMDNGSD